MSNIQKVIADFPSGLRTDQFHKEIVNSPIIATLTGVTTVGNAVNISFSDVINPGDIVLLNGLISAHVPDNSKPKYKFFIITPKSSITSTAYTVISTFKYPGSLIIGPIDYIEIVSYMDNSVTNYDIRIINRENGDIIASKTGNTNKELQVMDLGTISNIPQQEAILELHVRKNGGGVAKATYVDNLIVYYNN